MLYYLAPMEGITGVVYRNAYIECFGDIDRYFTPFLSPNNDKSFLNKQIREFLPENNKLRPVPQILTNRAELFLWAAYELETFGYREFNLNLGCPSGTVVSKGRGSGFLAREEELAAFFEAVYADPAFKNGDLKLSVKTRLGMNSPENFPRLLALYGQYPITELIVHPRTGKDQYRGVPDLKSFALAYGDRKAPLVYNGNIFTKEDADRIASSYPELHGMMLGRGILSDPLLMAKIRGRKPAGKETLRDFHGRIVEGYREAFGNDNAVLGRMKELWTYWGDSYPDRKKEIKGIKKSRDLAEYLACAGEILA